MSTEKCFHLTPIAISKGLSFQDIQFFFLLSLALLSYCCWIKYSALKESQVKTELHEFPAPGSWLKPIILFSYVGIFCVVWFGSSYTLPLSSVLFDLGLPIPCLFHLNMLLLSWYVGPPFSYREAHELLRPLGQMCLFHLSFLRVSWIEKKEKHRNWRVEHIFKGKRIG